MAGQQEILEVNLLIKKLYIDTITPPSKLFGPYEQYKWLEM